LGREGEKWGCQKKEQNRVPVIPDLIRNPFKNNTLWIPAFAGMTLKIDFSKIR